MKKILIALMGVGLFVVFSGAFSLPSKYEGKVVRKIEFVGIKNVDADDLLEVMATETGFPLKGAEIRQDLKAIFKAGQFENVSVEIEEFGDGVRIRFVCKERPLIKKIEFRGLDELYESDLLDLIKVKEGEPLRTDLLERSLKAIKKKYEDSGFFNAVVKYQVRTEKDDPNSVNVVFTIDEGEEIKVAKISILGTKKIAPESLTGIMETEEDGLFKSGKFKKDVFEQDKGKIIAFYKEKGYLDAQIIEDKVEYEWTDPERPEERVIYVTLKMSEGEKYYFDKYTVAGNKIFETKVFEEQFEQTETGREFNDTLFQKDRQMMSFTYASKGYIFARIVPKRSVDEREVAVEGKKERRKFVKIDFHIEEGSQAYIENIIVKGNKKTKDKVIRRELIVKEGELFDSVKMQVSREKIFNLGFFKQVNFDVRPGSREGNMNLIVDVEEQASGTISLGGGYGTTSGFSIFADVGENNLFGNGQRVGCKFEYGPLRSSITLSFTEPWLMDYPVGLTASIFYSLYTVPTSSMFTNSGSTAKYQKQQVGYSLGLSYRFWYYYGVGAIWSHAFKNLLNPTGNSPDAIFIEEAMGVQEKRTVTLYSYRDSKDNYMNPTRGSRVEFSVAFTGGYALGGDDHFIKYSPDLYYYFSPFHLPFLKSHPCVIELRGNGSFITPPLMSGSLQKSHPIEKNAWLESEDRLYIGGPETLRGWEYFDLEFPSSWRIGLFHRVIYGAEFRVPIHPQFLWLAFFFDAGSLWTDSFWEKEISTEYSGILSEDKKNKQLYDIKDFFNVDLMSYFKYSWGFGFKIQIPMMPLRFWFGQKLVWMGKDRGYFKKMGGFTFQFGIGDMRF